MPPLLIGSLSKMAYHKDVEPVLVSIYVFLILTKDLNTILPASKFIDNVILTEVIDTSNVSHMQHATDQ